MITSGCSGWSPNKAELAVADSIMGEWEVMGDPCMGADADKTFYGQSTFVLPVQGEKNAFIAIFDCWNKTDLENSLYIWLPLVEQADAFVVNWHDMWSLSLFKKK